MRCSRYPVLPGSSGITSVLFHPIHRLRRYLAHRFFLTDFVGYVFNPFRRLHMSRRLHRVHPRHLIHRFVRYIRLTRLIGFVGYIRYIDYNIGYISRIRQIRFIRYIGPVGYIRHIIFLSGTSMKAVTSAIISVSPGSPVTTSVSSRTLSFVTSNRYILCDE